VNDTLADKSGKSADGSTILPTSIVKLRLMFLTENMKGWLARNSSGAFETVPVVLDDTVEKLYRQCHFRIGSEPNLIKLLGTY